jgi:hypothetical protein
VKPRLPLLLFVVVAGVYLLSGKTFLGYDGEIMYRMSESLALRHSAVITDPIYHTSQPYSPYGIGLSLLLVPLTFAGWLILHDPRSLITLFQPAVSAGEALTLFILLVDFGCSYRRALLLALVFAFGTLAWYYSGVMFAEPAIGLTALLSLLWVARYARRPRRLLLVGSGVLLGTAVLLRWDALPLEVLPFAAYAGWQIMRHRPRWASRIYDAAAFSVPIIVAILINIGWDVIRFGRPLGGPQGNYGYGFNTPLWKGVFGLLLSPGAGLVIYVPVLLLIALRGLPIFVRLWRPEAVLIGALVVVRLLVYGRWWAWEGGTTWGPRYLIPVIGVMLIPLAFVPAARMTQILMIVYSTIGVAIEGLGQLVPFGLYYGPVASALVRASHLRAAPDGTPLPGAASEAVNNVIDFNWIYAPIPVQIQFLMHGIVDPMWLRIWPLAILALGLALLACWYLYRAMGRLDAVPTPTRTQAAKAQAS